MLGAKEWPVGPNGVRLWGIRLLCMLEITHLQRVGVMCGAVHVFSLFPFCFFSNFLDLLSNRVMHNQIQSRHRFVRHLRLVEVVGVLLYPYKR